MKLPNIRRKPLYSLKEVNDYIANYVALLQQLGDVHKLQPNSEQRAVLHSTHEVIERMNESLLKGKR